MTQTVPTAPRFSSPESNHDAFGPMQQGWERDVITNEFVVGESMHDRLRNECGVEDQALLNDLVAAGFSPSTLPSIDFIPLVFVAWASGEVTEKEQRVVLSLMLELPIIEFPKAMARVQSWLDNRPPEELLDLWHRYTSQRLSVWPPSTRHILGNEMIRRAEKIAVTSGGFLGVRSICPAERNMIRQMSWAFASAG